MAGGGGADGPGDRRMPVRRGADRGARRTEARGAVPLPRLPQGIGRSNSKAAPFPVGRGFGLLERIRIEGENVFVRQLTFEADLHLIFTRSWDERKVPTRTQIKLEATEVSSIHGVSQFVN